MSLYSPNDSDDFNFTDDQFNLLMSDYKETEQQQDISTDLFNVPDNDPSTTWTFTENQLPKSTPVNATTNSSYTLRPKASTRKSVQKTATSDSENSEQTSVKPKPTRNPMSQNAILAKANREKKKEFVASLQDRIKQLEYNNADLVSTTKRLRLSRGSLRQEVLYLKRVLHNDSSLANVLRRIDNVDQVSLSSRFSNERTALKDHDYTSNDDTRCTSSRPAAPQTTPGAGVCLYVDGGRVSFELCASCSRNASQPRRVSIADEIDDSSDEDVVVDDGDYVHQPIAHQAAYSSMSAATKKRKFH